MSDKLRRPLAALLLLAAAASARASDDFNIYSPHVTEGQSEVEFRGHQQSDNQDPSLQGERAYELSFAHAFTPWWKTEFYLGMYEREPGSPNTYAGHEFENIFQLTDTGHYWADVGFLAAYEYKAQPGEVSTLEFGPLFEKQSGRLRQRLNLIWEKQLGGGADRKYEFRSSYLMTYRFSAPFAPGFEAYYRPADDSRQLGPALYGEILTGRGNEFEYSAALLFGLNHAAPDRTFVLRLEYEFN